MSWLSLRDSILGCLVSMLVGFGAQALYRIAFPPLAPPAAPVRSVGTSTLLHIKNTMR